MAHRLSVRTAYTLDDDRQILRLVERIFGRHGIASRSFADSGDLFTALENHTPDALVIDLALGVNDAIDVMRKLGEMEYDGKVLLISGRDEVTLREATKVGIAHRLNMLRPLSKPFLPAELTSRLEDVAMVADSVRENASSVPVDVDLRSALENEWLALWYQPKFAIADLRLMGAEALIRLVHPEFGVVLPHRFLPPPGDRLWHRMSEFVLVQAMADWHAFAALGLPMKLSVNMPVSIIAGADFPRLVRELLPRRVDFPGLIIEITEDEVIGDAAKISEVAIQLKLCGVGLSVDDVGTAHSGLSRFLDVPFEEVKIDRRFVQGGAMDDGKRALCKMMVDLGHQFNTVVCAEGVEGQADLEMLAEIGCDLAQGFLLGRPATVKAFAHDHKRYHRGN